MAIEERMEKAIESCRREWSKIRTGMATPSLLDNVMVDYYGTPTPITHVANVAVPEARVIAISPWEKEMFGPIEKAIFESNLGLTPQSDGSFIRLNLPILTGERRIELAKQARKVGEEAKIAIRNIRRDENDTLKKDGKEVGMSEDVIKDELEEIQTTTNSFIKRVDELYSEKEADILKV
jgi:ribosome recycling factor